MDFTDISRMLARDGDGDGDGIEVSPTVISAIVFTIITVLVAFTMLFEVLEEKLLHNCEKTLKPIVSSLFGEMTILGFLNLVIYCISSLGILRDMSAYVINGSSEGQMYITEMLERIHYLLFFIMVLFIVQVIFLLNLSKTSVEEWKERNRQVQNAEEIEIWADRYVAKKPNRYCLNIHFDSKEERQTDPDRFFAFLSIRKEFLLHRTPIYPFRPMESNGLPVHFDFAHYMSICLGKTVAHVIHMPPVTWAAVWFLCGVFVVFYAVIDGNLQLMAAAWLLWGFVTFYGVSVLAHKLNQILAKLLNPADFPEFSDYKHSREFLPYAMAYETELTAKYSVSNSKESQPLNGQNNPMATLFTMPYWTKVKPCYGLDWRTNEHYITHRHHALFWFGKYGPEFLIFLVRLHLLMRSMYIALVVALFVPQLVGQFGLVSGSLYFLVAMSPVYLEYTSYLQELMQTLCLVTNSGLMCDNQALDQVLRRHKTRGAVRAIIMMTALVQATTRGTHTESYSTSKNTKKLRRKTVSLQLPMGTTQDEIHEIGDVFDMYDKDGSGEIQREELEDVMKSLGYSITHDQFTTMFNMLDVDGDGSITRTEFIDWHVRNHDSLTLSKKEMAKTMFDMFDTDNSGAIKISNLVERLKGLEHGLSTEDLMQLVNDLDTNRDGEISLEEFQGILKDTY